MEQQTFNLKALQMNKRGSAHASTNKIVGILIAVLLISVLGGTIFGYLGTGSNGLGNTTVNPSVPTWLPAVLIVLVAVAFVYMILNGSGITGK